MQDISSEQSSHDNFYSIKNKLLVATLQPLNENMPFVLECDALDVTISAVLNQRGCPVTFMSRTYKVVSSIIQLLKKKQLSSLK